MEIYQKKYNNSNNILLHRQLVYIHKIGPNSQLIDYNIKLSHYLGVFT